MRRSRYVLRTAEGKGTTPFTHLPPQLPTATLHWRYGEWVVVEPHDRQQVRACIIIHQFERSGSLVIAVLYPWISPGSHLRTAVLLIIDSQQH